MNFILDATSMDNKPPRISVNRVSLAHRRQRGQLIDFVKHTTFGASFRQLRDRDPFTLRPVRPHGTDPFLAFEVEFRAEQVVGEGGPYRQFFSDIGRELLDTSQQSTSPLFMPSPNRELSLGNNRDTFIIRPSATGSIHLALFVHLGVLFGCCIRTGVRLPVTLSSFFWKALVGDPLTRADLAAIDQPAVDTLTYVEQTIFAQSEPQSEVKSSSESVDSSPTKTDNTFVTQLSDGTIVEMKEDGSTTYVNASNCHEFIQLTLAARFCEQSQQIDAIRRGIAKIIPIQLLHLFTWQQLEMLIAGRETIDIHLLRRHTTYGGVDPNSQHIHWFWEILEEFDQYHRILFIRFSWGQDRLPIDDAEFESTHTRLLIKPSLYANPDAVLPRSDTCFFNLELPAYSTKDIMRTKLLYAVTTCSTMNADQVEEEHPGRRFPRREDDDY